jgi:hypothetical protein
MPKTMPTMMGTLSLLPPLDLFDVLKFAALAELVDLELPVEEANNCDVGAVTELCIEPLLDDSPVELGAELDDEP